MNRTVALVESPSQLLNVVEWAQACAVGYEVQVAVLLPADPATRRQLRGVARLADDEGITVRFHDLRGVAPAMIGDGARLLRQLARCTCLVVGDPFSGLIQSLLPLVRAAQIVVVDDGTATWEFTRCIDEQRPLVRWRVRGTGPARAARATRALSPSPTRQLSVFSSLADAAPMGARSLANAYEWTRRGRTPSVLPAAVDLIGSSLVESGVVEAAEYVAAVADLADRYGVGRYFAHRRESEAKLAEIEVRTGVQVLRAELPVELALRLGPVAARVLTFPSTAAHTLPVVLRGTGVRIEVRTVDSDWFTGRTGSHARSFVQRIADEAPAPQLRVPA